MVTLVSVSAALLISTAAAGGDWPKGHVVHENSESPDRQFGVVVPGPEEADDSSEDSNEANYLANLKRMNFSARLQTPITSRDRITAT